MAIYQGDKLIGGVVKVQNTNYYNIPVGTIIAYAGITPPPQGS